MRSEQEIPTGGNLPHLKHGATPYQEVARVFTGFHGSPDRFTSEVIEGVKRPAAVPFHPNRERNPDYYVHAHCTGEQLPYLRTAMAYLNGLAEGRAYGVAADEPSPILLRYRTLGAFRAQEENPRLTQAMFEAQVDILTEFAERYPNLMPALDAIYQLAGGGGTEFAILEARHYLYDAITLSPDLEKVKSRSEFIQVRVRDREPIFEVWCLGEVYAKTILREAIAAAHIIAEEDLKTVILKYDPQSELPAIPEGLAPKIVNHVKSLLAAVRETEAKQS